MQNEKNGPITDSFPIFSSFQQTNSKYVHYKMLPITGFELKTSGVGSNRSSN